MVFSEPLFLFLFLPLVIVFHFLAPKSLRNGVLLVSSLLFYAITEHAYTAVMLGYIIVNYSLALMLERNESTRDKVLVLALVANLGGLIFFKYTNFLAHELSSLSASLGLGQWQLAHIHLPIGISFFTFQAMSYVIDVHRREVRAEKSLFNLALFKAIFPQLIAGPIVRYVDVASQLNDRVTNWDTLAIGAQRFALGLGKKVLVANPTGARADQIFSLPGAELSTPIAWLGLLCYSIQIYFDFSGYSDMAIGLGRIFGFKFCENFNYPYVAQSVTDFWRRWHMSLSTWFRDYLYIPLGGNRRGPFRTYLNLVIVFGLCGLWHGASWNFLIWGLLHGALLVLERGPAGRWISALPLALRHAYVLLAVAIAWVFFRVESFGDALHTLNVLFTGHAPVANAEPLGYFIDNELLLAIGAGIIGSTPWPRQVAKDFLTRIPERPAALLLGASLAAMLTACGAKVAAGSYSPFIYFRF